MSGPAAQFHIDPTTGEARPRERPPLLTLLRTLVDGNEIRERRIPFAGNEPGHPRGRDDN